MQTLDRTIRRVRRVLMPWTQRAHVRPSEGHRPEGGYLREVVFGANDGLVSNVSLIAAVAGGTSDPKIVLLGGIAGLVAGSFSMGLGAYISTKSEREFRESEERRERWEIENMREQELAETRQIFRLKGITGPLLDEVVDAVSRDHEQWIALMMTEELGFSDQPPRPRLSAVIMALAFAVAAFFPVIPYLFTEGSAALGLSVGFAAVALTGMGGLRAYITGGAAVRKAIEMVGLAALAVVAANLVGRLVGVTI